MVVGTIECLKNLNLTFKHNHSVLCTRSHACGQVLSLDLRLVLVQHSVFRMGTARPKLP